MVLNEESNFLINAYDIKEFDVPLSEDEFKKYLLKYGDRYKVKKKWFFYKGDWHSDHIRCIICKNGSIQPFSLSMPILLFTWEYDTRQKSTYFKKRLPEYCMITQDGASEGVVIFPESKLNDDAERLEQVFGIRKKRQLNEETKNKLRLRMQTLNQLPKKKKD